MLLRLNLTLFVWQDALASLYGSSDAAAPGSAGQGLDLHFMPPASSAPANEALVSAPQPASAAAQPPQSPSAAGAAVSAATSGGESSDGGTAFAFGQLTSSLAEPLTFGGSPSGADGASSKAPSRVLSPTRPRCGSLSPHRGAVPSATSMRSGHPHKRAREDDLASAPYSAAATRPGYGGVTPPQPLQERGRQQRQVKVPGGPRVAAVAANAVSSAASASTAATQPLPDGEGRQCTVESASEVMRSWPVACRMSQIASAGVE